MTRLLSILLFICAMSVGASPTLTASWNPVDTANGYVLFIGIDTSNSWRSFDVGPNTNVTIPVPGGFEYFCWVKSYKRFASNGIPVYEFSGSGPQVSCVAMLPTNSPQLLLTKSNWEIMAFTTANGFLQSSSNLFAWSSIGGIASNIPNHFMGDRQDKQFFKILTSTN